MRKILSIDGGGIRGVIPAAVLVEIEERTGRPVAELFDLIAGTSTGGLLALESVLEEKYPSRGIERVLAQYFGDTMLSESLTEILVTSYDIERRSPFFFRRSRAREREGWDWQMRQAARATSAAPTYFEPVKLQDRNSSEYYALVDGGVFANNPAMCAYAEARTLWPDEEDFLVVSLGTGELTRSLPYEEVKGWGLALWAQPILNVVFDGVADTVDYQLRELLASEGDDRRYYRFQTVLDIGKDDMDDASRTNIAALKTKAREIISENDAALETLCAKLIA